MVGSDEFPFGALCLFPGASAVSFREGNQKGVSKNSGTPKSSIYIYILIGFFWIFPHKPSILGLPLFLETPNWSFVFTILGAHFRSVALAARYYTQVKRLGGIPLIPRKMRDLEKFKISTWTSQRVPNGFKGYQLTIP